MEEFRTHRGSAPARGARRTGGARIGHYAGAPIIFTSSWILLGILLVVLFAPIARRNWPEIGAWSYGVAALVVVVFGVSTLVHEMAHAITAHRMGLKITSISVTFWGGATRLAEASPTPRARALISGAGPAANLVLSAVSFAVWRAMSPGSIMWGLLALLTLVNLFVGILNLLPALPLDGGGILEAIFWAVKKDQYVAGRLTAAISRYIGVAIAIAPFLLFVLGRQPDMIILVWAVILGATMFATGSAVLRRPRPRVLPSEVFSPLVVVDASTPLTRVPLTLTGLDDAGPGQVGQVVVGVRDGGGHVRGWIDPRAVAQVPKQAREHTAAGAVSSSLSTSAVFTREPINTEEWAQAISELPHRVPGIIILPTSRAINFERLMTELLRHER